MDVSAVVSTRPDVVASPTELSVVSDDALGAEPIQDDLHPHPPPAADLEGGSAGHGATQLHGRERPVQRGGGQDHAHLVPGAGKGVAEAVHRGLGRRREPRAGRHQQFQLDLFSDVRAESLFQQTNGGSALAEAGNQGVFF